MIFNSSGNEDEPGEDDDNESGGGEGKLGISDLWPRLGRINVFHGTNVIVLLSAFALVLTVESSPIKNITAIVVGIIWIQLPLLEIDEYKSIREAGIPPVSLYWHIVTTLGIAALIVLTLETVLFTAPDRLQPRLIKLFSLR